MISVASVPWGVITAVVLAPLVMLAGYMAYWVIFPRRSPLADKNGKVIPGVPPRLVGGNIAELAYASRGHKISYGVNKFFNKFNSDTVCLQVPFRTPMVWTRDVDIVKAVCTGNYHDFPKAKDAYEATKCILGDGLVTSNFAMWKAHRLMINSTFRANHLKSMTEDFIKHTQQLVDILNGKLDAAEKDPSLKPKGLAEPQDLQALLRKKPWVKDFAGMSCHADAPNQPLNHLDEQHFVEVDFHLHMNGLTADIIFDTGFSSMQGFKTSWETDDNIYVKAIADLLREVELRGVDPLPALTDKIPTARQKRFRRAKTALDTLIGSIVDERVAQRKQGIKPKDTDRHDLLDLMLRGSEEAEAKGGPSAFPLDNKILLDQMYTLLGAGHETTATLLTWTIYELGHHPDVLLKLQEEIDTILQGRAPTFNDLKSLPYTEMVLKEGLRLHPPVGAFGRDTPVGLKTKDWDFVPNQQCIFINVVALHRDPKNFDSPECFMPERFSKGYEGKKPTAFTYIPFSSGPRHCIGMRYAHYESLVILSMFIQNFDFRLVHRGPIDYIESITRRPRHGLPIYISKRKPVHSA